MLRALAVIAAILCSSCDLFQKVTADKVLVVTWIDAPAISVPPFDTFGNFGVTTVTAIFASKGSGISVNPVHGGFAAFFGAGKKVDLTETPIAGTYAATSAGNPILIYDTNPQHRYGFIACAKNSANGCVGDEYDVNEILAAPILSKDTLALSPVLGPSQLPGFDGTAPAGQALSVSFPPAPPGDQYRPFVTVFGLGADNNVSQVYSSLPTNATDFLQFLNSNPPMQVTIPAGTLKSGPYVVLAVTARLSLDTTTNLFLGSGALAGSASAFIIDTQ